MLSPEGVEKILNYYQGLVVDEKEFKSNLESFLMRSAAKGSVIRIEEEILIVGRGFVKNLRNPMVMILGRLNKPTERNLTLIIEGENVFS